MAIVSAAAAPQCIVWVWADALVRTAGRRRSRGPPATVSHELAPQFGTNEIAQLVIAQLATHPMRAVDCLPIRASAVAPRRPLPPFAAAERAVTVSVLGGAAVAQLRRVNGAVVGRTRAFDNLDLIGTMHHFKGPFGRAVAAAAAPSAAAAFARAVRIVRVVRAVRAVRVGRVGRTVRVGRLRVIVRVQGSNAQLVRRRVGTWRWAAPWRTLAPWWLATLGRRLGQRCGACAPLLLGGCGGGRARRAECVGRRDAGAAVQAVHTTA